MVFGIAWCSICKSCFVYKKLVNCQERLMGKKNILDHLKIVICVVPEAVEALRKRLL